MDNALVPGDVRRARLEEWMAAYGTQILRMCAVILRDAALAEDAAQDTFLKAYRRMDSLHGQGGEKAWLMRIAVNTCRDYLRGSWFRHVDRRVDIDALAPGFCEMDTGGRELFAAILQLPAKFKETVLLYYYENMTLEEIARCLGVPKSTVHGRLRRAHKRLRDKLEGWYEDE